MATSGRRTSRSTTSSPRFGSGANRGDGPDALLVDTDVLSYLFREDTRVEPFRPYLTGAVLLVSFMTIAELERWMLQRNWSNRQREQLRNFLTQFTTVMVDRALCRTWGEVVDRARRAGRPIQVADAWIAATAISLGIPLITNNRDDFLGVAGLRILPDVST